VTPSRTPTLTPSPTATFVPTHTPAPVPDYVQADLVLADLPPGFQAFPGLPTPDADTSSFSWGYSSGAIFGYTFHLSRLSDRYNWDAVLSNPSFFLKFLSLQFSSTDIKNLQPSPGLDHYGARSAGYTALWDMFAANIFAIRNGPVGMVVVTWYPKGDKPPLSLAQLAAIVDKRLSAAVK
jgi:hypothetical protein